MMNDLMKKTQLSYKENRKVDKENGIDPSEKGKVDWMSTYLLC